MTTPRIVHCKRSPYDVYIGREMPGLEASIWGNPFVIGLDGDRAKVISRYAVWLRTGESFGNPDATEERRQGVLTQLGDLKGKTLGCWCFPLACHGQVLLDLLKEQGIEP